MARKINKKTRNVISGLLVGLASVFAIINFADIPADEVGSFLLSTAIFFLGIVLLAFIAVSFFKFLGWLKNTFFSAEIKEENHSQDDLESGVSGEREDRE